MNYSLAKETTGISVQLPSSELLKRVFKEALENSYALALWQLPHDSVQHCIVDFSTKPRQISADLEECPSGFLVNPFQRTNTGQSYFIQADFQLEMQGEQWSFRDTEAAPEKFRQRIFSKNSNVETSAEINQFRHFLKTSQKHITSTQESYEALVAKGMEAIQSGQFLKVVLSRTKSEVYSQSMDIINFFQKLSQNYPTAFRYFFHMPGVGTWMGASPETLISVDQQQIFRTVALAGTQAFQANKKLSQVAWTQKEIEEQALVARYIINCFKKIRLREFDEEGPKTVVAGNLMHLCTRFQVDMQACNFPQLGTVMLNLLHPTSAVCGMPKEPALDFILKHENYDREFYSGFLGPVNINRESHLYVNLRCMQFLADSMVFYAGAGITEDSEPAKEWKETEMKCETLTKILRSL